MQSNSQAGGIDITIPFRPLLRRIESHKGILKEHIAFWMIAGVKRVDGDGKKGTHVASIDHPILWRDGGKELQ